MKLYFGCFSDFALQKWPYFVHSIFETWNLEKSTGNSVDLGIGVMPPFWPAQIVFYNSHLVYNSLSAMYNSCVHDPNLIPTCTIVFPKGFWDES